MLFLSWGSGMGRPVDDGSGSARYSEVRILTERHRHQPLGLDGSGPVQSKQSYDGVLLPPTTLSRPCARAETERILPRPRSFDLLMPPCHHAPETRFTGKQTLKVIWEMLRLGGAHSLADRPKRGRRSGGGGETPILIAQGHALSTVTHCVQYDVHPRLRVVPKSLPGRQPAKPPGRRGESHGWNIQTWGATRLDSTSV